MEQIRQGIGIRPGLAVSTDIFGHRCEIRLYGVQSFDDGVEIPFECVHARPQALFISGDRFDQLWWFASVQYRIDVLRVPTQRGGKRFQGPCVSASLDNVVLEFADGRPRDMRTFRE
jgi:hypothetical protein